MRTDNEFRSPVPLCLLAFFFFIASFVMGISPVDNSSYLQYAFTAHPSSFLHNQDWSPLYLSWFRVLGIVIPNPIARYFFSWGFLVACLALLPWLTRTAHATIYAVILLGFPFLSIEPFVSHFGAAILLGSTCLVLRRQRPVSQVLAIYCGTAFVVAFARPEFDYGVYLSALLAVAALSFEHLKGPASATPKKPLWMPSIVIGCIVIVLAASLFAITRQSRYPRSGIAFAQHFNRRAAEQHLIPAENSWESDYTQRQFGLDLQHNANTTTASVFDYFRARPKLFLRHVLVNLVDPRAVWLIVVLALFVLWPWVHRKSWHLRSASFFVLLIGIPCVAASLMIYPRSHVRARAHPSLTIYALQLIQPDHWLRLRPIWMLGIGCGLIWLTNIGLPARIESGPSGDRVYLQRIECTRHVDLYAPDQPTVFEAVQMFSIYFSIHELPWTWLRCHSGKTSNPKPSRCSRRGSP